jgi:hypothetical protein
MIIEAPAEWDDYAYRFAEWLELMSIQRWPNPSGEAELRALLEGTGDDLKLFSSQSEMDEAVESKVQEVFEELDRRAVWADGGYPFVLNRGKVTLETGGADLGSTREPSVAYLFALAATYYRHVYYKGLKTPKDEHDSFPGRGDLEDLFQVCGTIAAAGFVNGHSISFGWPRADGSAFYEKLASVGKDLGDGVPKSAWAPGASPKPNDGAVDIVAWRHCPDRLPGQLYMLGQCASGDNWETGKLPLMDHSNFHEYYWSQQPHSPLVTGTFVPFDYRVFVMESIPAETREEAWRAERWRLTKTHGVIFDRFRLAHFFANGLRTAAAGTYSVESVDALPRLKAWVRGFLEFLRT